MSPVFMDFFVLKIATESGFAAVHVGSLFSAGSNVLKRGQGLQKIPSNEKFQYIDVMKKVYLIGLLCFICSGLYALLQLDNADCCTELTSKDCPCTPDCMPGDAWCTCPQACSN